MCLKLKVTIQKNHLHQINVRRLDASGGEITVDPTSGYNNLTHWLRNVTWSADYLIIKDDVLFLTDVKGSPLFRWHLGTLEKPTIQKKRNAFHVRWSDGKLTLKSSVPITVTTEMLPDHTVKLGEMANGWDYLHVCLIVKPVKKINEWHLQTSVIPV